VRETFAIIFYELIKGNFESGHFIRVDFEYIVEKLA